MQSMAKKPLCLLNRQVLREHRHFKVCKGIRALEERKGGPGSRACYKKIQV